MNINFSSVKFLGVKVEQTALPRWRTDISDQDIEEMEEKAARMIQEMWNSANGEEKS